MLLQYKNVEFISTINSNLNHVNNKFAMNFSNNESSMRVHENNRIVIIILLEALVSCVIQCQYTNF